MCTRSTGTGLVYQGASGCGACPPNPDCYVWGCAAAMVPALRPPDRSFALLTVLRESEGASGRDAPPGPGAASWLLLALTVAALRVPPVLGLRAGEPRRRQHAGGPSGQGPLGRGSLQILTPASCSCPSGLSWGELKRSKDAGGPTASCPRNS